MSKQKKYLNDNCEIPEFINKELNIKEESLKRGKTSDIVFCDEAITDEYKEEIENIESKSPTEEETNGPETKNGKIANALCVNVRKEPNFESESLEVLRKGDKVTILGKVGDFYKVSTSVNKLAYISFEFVEEE